MMEKTNTERETYLYLREKLGEEFVHKTLFETLGFDNAMDSATSGKIQDAISHIVTDIDLAINFCKGKILKEQNTRFKKYFGMIDNNIDLAYLKVLILNMIDNITNNISDSKTEDSFYDFIFFFTFNTGLKFQLDNIFGKSTQLKGFTIAPNTQLKDIMSGTEFGEKIIIFLNNFENKLKKSYNSDKKIVSFLSEFMNKQSGKSAGIGNQMNPLIMFWTLDEFLGEHEEGSRLWTLGAYKFNQTLKDKIINKTNAIIYFITKIPRTIENRIPGSARNKRFIAGKKLNKIIYNYMFTEKQNAINA